MAFENSPSLFQCAGKRPAHFRLEAMTGAVAREIATWRYAAPYSIYDLSKDVVDEFLDPANRYFSLVDNNGVLVGFCCFGREARVRGGETGGA